jgi:hypothetical protein
LQDPIWQKPFRKKRATEVTQGVDPEFKHQYVKIHICIYFHINIYMNIYIYEGQAGKTSPVWALVPEGGGRG